MSKFPKYIDVIDAISLAIAATETQHQDHTYLPDAKKLAKAALIAFFDIVPACEDPDSAAYCYEKLEAMRDEQKE